MRKIIAAINMTLDGFCDHTAGIADDELHQHFNNLLINSDTILYGRITYQLMEYWRTVLTTPTGNRPMDEFAVTIDHISKIVFSHTLKNTDWKTARVANRGVKEEISDLLQKPGKDILVGSPSLIVQCMNLNLIDECQFVIHPIVLGSGLPLFKNITEKTELKLIKTKTLGSGAVALYYKPVKK